MTVAKYGLDAGDTLRLVLELPVMRCRAVEEILLVDGRGLC